MLPQLDKKVILDFLSSLTTEKKYFFFVPERIVNAEILIPKFEKGELAGLCGIYRRYGLPTFFIVVRTDYQGGGYGKELMEELQNVLKKRHYSFVLLNVHRLNPRAIEIYKKQGYLTLGVIKDLVYMIMPFNVTGKMFYSLLRVPFIFYQFLGKSSK